MSSQQKHKIQVPDGLRDVLLEFSIAYLLEQPGDVIDYAVEFFTKLQENRKTTMITIEPMSPDESILSHEEGIYLKICIIYIGYPEGFVSLPSIILVYFAINQCSQYFCNFQKERSYLQLQMDLI